MVNKVGDFKQVIAARKQGIQQNSKPLVHRRIGMQFAMRRFMRQAETKLHDEGEYNRQRSYDPESFCVRGRSQESERDNNRRCGQNRIQRSGDRVMGRIRLTDKVSLRYRLAEDESIVLESICDGLFHWDRSGDRRLSEQRPG
jgi:hypothetical protein